MTPEHLGTRHMSPFFNRFTNYCSTPPRPITVANKRLSLEVVFMITKYILDDDERRRYHSRWLSFHGNIGHD